MKNPNLFAISLIVCFFAQALELTAQDFYHTGSEEPIETNHLPGVVLAGGATDNDDAMKWMLERADGGDVVVLRASGSDGYNNYFYSGLDVTVNSVTSIVIQSEAQANSEEVVDILNNAEVVFIAGGNQWNYVNYWRDSALLEALQQLITEKQITIGGTSAGMAVLGEVVFTAENATVWSSEALNDPYHWRVMLEKDFLDVPYMQNTVTDTHYNRPENDNMDRKGRHVAFMARMVADWDMPARGIAANEYTAIAIDENGKARVFGHPNYPDYGYFLQKYGGPPEICEEGTPLTWYQDEKAIKTYKIKGDFAGSGWFDMNSWIYGEGGEWEYWFVQEGALYETEADDNTGMPSQPALEPAVSVFPNPVDNVLNIIIDPDLFPLTGELHTVRILTVCGTEVHTITSPRMLGHINYQIPYSVNVEHLPSGVYILELHDGRSNAAIRWIKQ